MTNPPDDLVITPTARGQLSENLPESAAFAAYEFIVGPLLENPTAWGNTCGHRWRIDTALGGGPIG